MFASSSTAATDATTLTTPRQQSKPSLSPLTRSCPDPTPRVFYTLTQIVLHAIPRLLYPTEVASGWSFILLALGGVFVNLVGVLFFLTAGQDEHQHHGGGFLHAHSHSHDHGYVRRRLLPSPDPRALRPRPRVGQWMTRVVRLAVRAHCLAPTVYR